MVAALTVLALQLLLQGFAVPQRVLILPPDVFLLAALPASEHLPNLLILLEALVEALLVVVVLKRQERPLAKDRRL